MPAEPNGRSVYDLMLELDRLEEIREDMVELGFRTLEEVEAYIANLHRRIEAFGADEPSDIEER